MVSLGMPEADLVVLGAREGLSEAVMARMEECARRCARVGDFVRLCSYHKVDPLVLRSVEGLDHGVNAEFLVPAVEGLWRHRSRNLALQRARVLGVMERTQQVMESIGAPFAFIRGPRLAEQFYAEPALRVSADVDILIPSGWRKEALAALASAGFGMRYTGIEQEARSEYKGQATLAHRRWRVYLDVNWALTGNVGIGRVEQDIEEVWRRATPIGGVEWRLSNEDVLLGLIRHVGHGHGFEHGLVQCCVDVAAILRKHAEAMDWDYMLRAAKQCECLRVIRFFAHFYDAYYRDDTMPSLSEFLAGVGPRAHPARILRDSPGTFFSRKKEVPEPSQKSEVLARQESRPPWAARGEARVFFRLVLAPLVRRDAKPDFATPLIYATINHTGRLWALDRLPRLLTILFTLLWPSKHERVIMTPGAEIEPVVRRRVRYYFLTFLPILPAVGLGTCARLIVALYQDGASLFGGVRSFVAGRRVGGG